jgi:hypothetical protein
MDYTSIQEQIHTGYFDHSDDMLVMSDTEREELETITDTIHDLAGDYPKFESVEDARQFLNNLEQYIETEGYSPSHAYDLVMKDMGL